MDSITLSWFAGLSNFYSMLSVLVCFCIMVVFILRLNGDHFMSSSATHYNTPKEQPMTKLHNPFSIKVSESKLTSLKDGLNIEVSVKSMSRVEIFWGVNIQIFQKEIHKPVCDIYKRLIDKQTFDEKYLHRLNLGDIGVTDRPCELYSKCPETVTESSLGPPPRQLYPVVVISVIENLETMQESQSVAAQFTIIHLKDSMCPLDSHIVYQFVKTNQNNLLSLQPIFLSSSEQNFSSSNATTSETIASTSDLATDTCLKGTEARQSQNTSRNTMCSCELTKTCDESNVKTAGNSELENSDSAVNKNGNECGVIDGKIINKNVEEKCKIEQDTSIKDDDEGHIGLDETNTCIICQSAVIYYTLLPCRHACVCVSCVRLVDRCPLCRCYIDAFFRLFERDHSLESSFSESDSQSDIHVPAATIWEALNQRLNEMFGLA